MIHEPREGTKGTLLVVEHNPYNVTANDILGVLHEHLDESVFVVKDGGKNAEDA